MEKRGTGGTAIGKERVWSLAYVDDMMLLAKNKVDDMMDMLRKFFKVKKLEFCTEKTKVVVFNNKERIGKEK